MTSSTLPYAYFKKKIVPIGEANVNIAANSLQYGTTCFAGIRGYVREGKVKVFRLYDHYERLMSASKIMGMNCFYTFEEFEEAVRGVVLANRPSSDFYLRPFIYSPVIELSPKPVAGLHFELAIYCVPLGHYFDPNKGMRMMVSSWRKFSDAMMPTKAKAGGCYVNSFLITGEAIRCGYDEALVADHEGCIVEASVANLVMVHRDRVIIPSVGSAQLEGITLRTVIELLAEEGVPVHYEKIDRSMVYACSELLLTGTAAQIAFVESVDNRKIGVLDPHQEHPGPGKLCQLLRQKYQEILNGTHPKSSEWIKEWV